MKSFFIILTFLLIFTACADKNAFTKFNMLPKQELGISSLQSSKIKTEEHIDGIVSAIYLNEVYPDIYNGKEYFYIYLYLKERKDEIKFTLKLNSKLPIKVEELPNKNKFSHLSSIEGKWQRYFLVSFEKESKSELSLVFKNGPSSSDKLIYQKDEQ